MRSRKRLGLSTLLGLVLLVGGVAAAEPAFDLQVDSDVVPRMAVEEIADRVADLLLATNSVESGGSSGTSNSSIGSVRCTRANRLWDTRNEKGNPDTRTVWVVEVKGETGTDGAFYVLDDETGKVLAHGVVAAARGDGGAE